MSVAVSSVPWEINGISATGLSGTQPAFIPGRRGNYQFVFIPDETVVEPHLDRYNQIRELGSYAGLYHRYITTTGDVYWYERRPANSPLVKLVPDPDSTTGRAIWGLINDMDDGTTLSRAQCELTLDIFMIAPVGTGAGEFETEQELRAARMVRGP